MEASNPENCEDSVVSNEDMFASSCEDNISPECSKTLKQHEMANDADPGSSKGGKIAVKINLHYVHLLRYHMSAANCESAFTVVLNYF